MSTSPWSLLWTMKMATGFEQASGESQPPDALHPPSGAEALGHFQEDDAGDQDAYSALMAMLNLGTKGKLALLARILARCQERANLVIGPCYLWNGPTSGNGRGRGYGRFSFEGKTASVHRTVYEICWGPIPNRKQIDHICCNRNCCNPKHLVRVTHRQNQKLRDKRNSQ